MNGLRVEWQYIESEDFDQRLLRVFEILFNNQYLYEEKNEDSE